VKQNQQQLQFFPLTAYLIEILFHNQQRQQFLLTVALKVP
jgi:hypothetical protein